MTDSRACIKSVGGMTLEPGQLNGSELVSGPNRGFPPDCDPKKLRSGKLCAV